MLVKSEAIILQNIKYADKKAVIKAFTKKHGLLTFSAIITKSSQAKIKPASVLPLTVTELSYALKQNRDIQLLTESNIAYVYDDISRNYLKLAIAQFMNEVLIKCIKEHVGNEELFAFVVNSYKWLNEAKEGYSNLHIYFLLELSKHLGFEPNNNYSANDKYFDTREGKFTPVELGFPLGLNNLQSQLFSQSLNEGLIDKPFSRSERNELIESYLAFYKMHVAGFSDLKSPSVLKELFA